jgi:hypothetical protein
LTKFESESIIINVKRVEKPKENKINKEILENGKGLHTQRNRSDEGSNSQSRF